MLATINDPSHVKELSGRPAGTNDIYASKGIVVTGSRFSGTGDKGDSAWGELGCGLDWMLQNCMDPERKRLAREYDSTDIGYQSLISYQWDVIRRVIMISIISV